MKSEFFWGIVVGVVLTIIGSLIQFQLIKEYENQKSYTNELFFIDKMVNTRVSRSVLIAPTSGSSVFEKRWDSYMEDALFEWNDNLSKMEYFFKRYHSDKVEDFEFIADKFRDLHNSLLTVRRNQKTKTEEGNKIRESAEKRVKTITKEINNKWKALRNKL